MCAGGLASFIMAIPHHLFILYFVITLEEDDAD